MQLEFIISIMNLLLMRYW